MQSMKAALCAVALLGWMTFGCSESDDEKAGSSSGGNGNGGSSSIGGSSGSGFGGSATGGVAGASGSAGSGGSSDFDPSYPRLGSYAIGNPHNYDSESFREIASKQHVVIVGQWPGWESGRSMTMAEVVADVKQRSKVGTKMFVYVNNNEKYDPAQNSDTEIWDKLTAEKWWLYPTGTSGTPVRSTWGDAFGICNNTMFCPKDENGKNWIEWKADYDYAFIVAGDDKNAANPLLDGFFLDNVFWTPRVNGDWNQDGTTDDQDDPTVQGWLREGGKHHADYMQQIWPGSVQLANIADWGNADAEVGVLAGVYDGGVLEGMLGETWSTEQWGGFDQMMAAYRKMMDALRGPKLGVFGHDAWEPGNYQNMRYGLATCLMDDAYFYITGDNYSPDGMLWFDEFDVDLGHATQARQDKAWKQGVWRRDFEKGIALVNPKGNGPQTVSLDASFKKLTGAQDPSVNDGSTVTSVTLEERDGIILLVE